MGMTGAVTSSEPEARARALRAGRGGGRDSEPAPSPALRARIDHGPADGDPAGLDAEPEPACFSLAALVHDLRAHPELDQRTLAYHLQQCDATAADGYCHAAINEARSFLEALVVGIRQALERNAEPPGGANGGRAGTNGGNGRSGSQNGTAFRTYRRYLLEAGFIDADENDLLQYVYSAASAKGGHHGVTDEAWTRLARRIVFAAGQYLLQRYAAWKREGRAAASPAEKEPPPARRRWLPRVITGLIRKDRPAAVRTTPAERAF